MSIFRTLFLTKREMKCTMSVATRARTAFKFKNLNLNSVCVSECVSRRWVSSTSYVLAKVTVDVPALGESISEGSVASFEKAVGDVVNVDDIIAVIETDKVTVDIKSPYNGTLLELLCGESDEITVGSPLYSIDTDDSVVATPSPSASSSSENKPDTQAAPASSSPTTTKSSNSHKRVPLIKFLGKRSLLKKSDHSTTVESTNTTATAEYGHELSPVASLYDNYDAAGLGRPALTDEEIEAVETGGASLFG